MARLWDLDDLAGLGDLAAEHDISSSGAAGWRDYPDFPAPLITLSPGPVYSRAQVRVWLETHWPGGARRASSRRPRSYEHIKADLRDRITGGEFRPGGRIPSRPELAEHYSVSTRAMARPIADLCREGLLYTRPASGTYVSPDPKG